MKNSIDDIGIIDEVNSPFGQNKNDWVRQNGGLTNHRRTKLMPLLNRNSDEIINHKLENESRYPAFVAVRWCFAVISDEGINKILVKTFKLDDYLLYDTRVVNLAGASTFESHIKK